ncbi:MAG: beta-lactamase family protein [Clostridia bacterium]|nr:beta-lactamase family protein [Clostridia bacterium]
MSFSRVKNLIDTMPQRGIPFFEIAVTKSGKEVFRHRVGFSDADGKRALASDDLYWLYSTSKPITCTAAMRLIEEGIIDLRDPVSKYIPSFERLTVKRHDGSIEPCKTRMTIEHLFTMTSGIGPDHEKHIAQCVSKSKPNGDTLSLLASIPEIPLHFEPGTHYQYGLSHDVLAGVVEVASGIRFSEYVKKYILEPLGMSNTGYRPTNEQRSRFASTYKYNDSNGTSTPVPTNNWLLFTPEYDSGGAGLFSCCQDYIKFATVLACGGVAPNGYRLLSEESIKMMGENRLCDEALKDFVQGRLHGYGWGLCGRAHINPVFSLSKSAIGEFGWDGAAGCFTSIDRENEVAIFFGMQVLNCSYSYIILQPLIRTLVYEALEAEEGKCSK